MYMISYDYIYWYRLEGQKTKKGAGHKTESSGFVANIIYVEKLTEKSMRIYAQRNQDKLQMEEKEQRPLNKRMIKQCQKNQKQLQFMMKSVVIVGKEFGIKIIAGKTKIIRIGQNEGFVNITLEGKL